MTETLLFKLIIYLLKANYYRSTEYLQIDEKRPYEYIQYNENGRLEMILGQKYHIGVFRKKDVPMGTFHR